MLPTQATKWLRGMAKKRIAGREDKAENKKGS
jgi:hypothetical protein